MIVLKCVIAIIVALCLLALVCSLALVVLGFVGMARDHDEEWY